jgi:hypothetical protein
MAQSVIEVSGSSASRDLIDIRHRMSFSCLISLESCYGSVQVYDDFKPQRSKGMFYVKAIMGIGLLALFTFAVARL